MDPYENPLRSLTVVPIYCQYPIPPFPTKHQTEDCENGGLQYKPCTRASDGLRGGNELAAGCFIVRGQTCCRLEPSTQAVRQLTISKA